MQWNPDKSHNLKVELIVVATHYSFQKACCAVYFFTDWRTTEFAHNRYDKVPQSCCKKASTGCTGYEFKIDEINDKVCFITSCM